MTTTLLETNCKIALQGQTYEAGGAYLLPCTDGKYRGVVYVKMIERTTPAGLPVCGVWPSGKACISA